MAAAPKATPLSSSSSSSWRFRTTVGRWHCGCPQGGKLSLLPQQPCTGFVAVALRQHYGSFSLRPKLPSKVQSCAPSCPVLFPAWGRQAASRPAACRAWYRPLNPPTQPPPLFLPLIRHNHRCQFKHRCFSCVQAPLLILDPSTTHRLLSDALQVLRPAPPVSRSSCHPSDLSF